MSRVPLEATRASLLGLPSFRDSSTGWVMVMVSSSRILSVIAATSLGLLQVEHVSPILGAGLDQLVPRLPGPRLNIAGRPGVRGQQLEHLTGVELLGRPV